jgi:hypothetical protein
MEQQQEKTTRQFNPNPINIQLSSDGELNLSGITLENLTDEEFILVQRIIDESQRRSQNSKRVQELMQQGVLAQTAIAGFAVIMFFVMGSYSIVRLISSVVSSQESVVRGQELGVRSQEPGVRMRSVEYPPVDQQQQFRN